MTDLFNDKEHRDRVLGAEAIIAELKQFDKLRAIDPPITCAQIAFRMVWSKRDTRWLLTKMGDKRP
jgi:hypothetical protein